VALGYLWSVADTSTIASALAPGVALTSAVIYWANLQARLDNIATRVRTLNSELRGLRQSSPRALSVERQVEMLFQRSRVLHVGVVLSVIALIGFLGASATLFLVLARVKAGEILATGLFTMGLVAFGVSLLPTLWEMLSSYRSLEEDVRSSRPRPEQRNDAS
jgi:hypothetical protein